MLRPESSDEVIEQFAGRALSEAGMLEAFDRLHAASRARKADGR